jgi:hypothetical protein
MIPSLLRLGISTLLLLALTAVTVDAYWSALHADSGPSIEGSFSSHPAATPRPLGPSACTSDTQRFPCPVVEDTRQAQDQLGA